MPGAAGRDFGQLAWGWLGDNAAVRLMRARMPHGLAKGELKTGKEHFRHPFVLILKA